MAVDEAERAVELFAQHNPCEFMRKRHFRKRDEAILGKFEARKALRAPAPELKVIGAGCVNFLRKKVGEPGGCKRPSRVMKEIDLGIAYCGRRCRGGVERLHLNDVNREKLPDFFEVMINERHDGDVFRFLNEGQRQSHRITVFGGVWGWIFRSHFRSL